MASDLLHSRGAGLALAGLVLLTACQPVRTDRVQDSPAPAATAAAPVASAPVPPAAVPSDQPDATQTAPPELLPEAGTVTGNATDAGPPAPGRGADVFARIRKNLSPNACAAGSNSVRWRKRYAGNPDVFARHLEQTLPLMDFVSIEVERTGLPSEFVFIPLVESWYKPGAMGPGGPAGMWQMIASTARNHGIHITPGYDGRLSPVESTRAALSYLKVLQQMFGGWEAIVMAYNAGEGRMLSAFKRARSREVSAAARRPHGMSNITYDYVAKLQALSCLIAEPERSGLRLPAAARFVPLLPVLVGPEQSTIEQFARARGLDTGDMRKLNPGYKSGRIVAGVPRLLLTPSYARLAPETLALADQETDPAMPAISDPPPAPAAPNLHEVRAGDTLWSIAKRYGLSMDTLRQINGLGKTGMVRPGQKIRLSP
jgi:membrane-bound lytic murein transglycosylase D